jgi:hypothetical protein
MEGKRMEQDEGERLCLCCWLREGLSCCTGNPEAQMVLQSYLKLRGGAKFFNKSVVGFGLLCKISILRTECNV